MKKLFYALPALALVMASCSNDGPFDGTDQVTYAPGNGYMSFNIVSPTSLGTRATTTPDNGEGVYEDGKDNENNVASVRFFFFDEFGNAFGVNKHLTEEVYESYIDWYPTEADVQEGDPNKTIESTLQAAIQVNLKKDVETDQWLYPKQVVAVLNPTPGIIDLTTSGNAALIGPNLSELEGALADYQTGLTTDKFVMSNSVYVKNFGATDAAVVNTADITEENIKETAEAARESAVTVYVERVVARVDFGISDEFTTEVTTDDDGEPIYKVGTYQVYKTETVAGEGDAPATTKQVISEETLYVKFTGWNVTQVASQSNLLKTINKAWTNEQIMGSPVINWNTYDYRRSFWAYNPEAALQKTFYRYGTFSKTKNPETGTNYYPADGNTIPVAGEFASPIYIQENANPYSIQNVLYAPGQPLYPTNIIVAAQIVDVHGTPFEITEWMGHKYTMSAMMSQLVATLMTTQPTQSGLYSYTGTTGNYTFNPITVEDLELVYSDPATTTGDLNEPQYYTYVTLSETGKAKDWCIGTALNAENGINDPLTDEAAINHIREMLGHVLVWGSGDTYYNFDIRHLAAEPQDESVAAAGYYGIVRNHIYRITVKSVEGLGVPVFDPSEIITPEEKTETEAMLSAEIKILQWRVVAQDYELTW